MDQKKRNTKDYIAKDSGKGTGGCEQHVGTNNKSGIGQTWMGRIHIGHMLHLGMREAEEDNTPNWATTLLQTDDNKKKVKLTETGAVV